MSPESPTQEILTIVETVLPVTADVLSLVAAYAGRKILPAKYEADMRHIALATLAKVDSLVSGNFKHVVRLEKIRLFNEVNVTIGASGPEHPLAKGGDGL